MDEYYKAKNEFAAKVSGAREVPQPPHCSTGLSWATGTGWGPQDPHPAGGVLLPLGQGPFIQDLVPQATEDQIKLLRLQRHLQEDFDKPYLDLSLHDTVSTLILDGHYKKAEQLYRDFKIPDKRWGHRGAAFWGTPGLGELRGLQPAGSSWSSPFPLPPPSYWWLKINALATRGDWEEMEKFSKSKKSPIGYLVRAGLAPQGSRQPLTLSPCCPAVGLGGVWGGQLPPLSPCASPQPFVEIAVKHHNRYEAKKYAPRVTPEQRVKAFILVGYVGSPGGSPGGGPGDRAGAGGSSWGRRSSGCGFWGLGGSIMSLLLL